MGKETDYYKYIQDLYQTNREGQFIQEFKDYQDIVLLIDILSIEFVPEHLRCFKAFDGESVIGYFLGTLNEMGYEITYEDAKQIYKTAKKRIKLKKKLLIKESLEI